MVIATKRQMYRLFDRGAFGNRLRGWNGADAFERSGFTGLVGCRHTLRTGFKFAARDNVPAADLAGALRAAGVNPYSAGLQVTEGAPDDRLSLQGELCRAERELADRGLILRYSTDRLKMRQAMEGPNVRHAYRLEADHVLRRHLLPASYDDVMDLLELYPGSVVEFSAYQMPLGSCRQRNAVVWEVRHY